MRYLAYFLFFTEWLLAENTNACSLYKLTINGKTIVGCNEDAWRTTPVIWFEKSSEDSNYSAAFTGSRLVGPKTFTPQSGMNELGLTFSRLASYHPKQESNQISIKPITNEAIYLKSILHNCATVQQVKTYIEAYDYSTFIDDVFIYIDSTGNYLIVEPYSLTIGNDTNYVLANFCPSITTKESARKQERYKNGEDFIQLHAPVNHADYFKALSDTMSVCRKRNGDGTLLTSIWNTNAKSVQLYFYHDYSTSIEFNLLEQFNQNDTTLAIASLFPVNQEFQRLESYITPFNTPSIRFGLVIVSGILVVLTLVLLVYMQLKKFAKAIVGLLALLNVLLVIYFAVLATNQYIFYFDAPYNHYSSSFISATSYIPFVILGLLAFALYVTIQLRKSIKYSLVPISALAINLLIIAASVAAFGYWGLYSVVG